MSNKGQIAESAGTGRMMRPVAVSVAIGAVVCVVILLVLSIVISAVNVPQSAINPMAVLAISAGAFSSGLSCSKIIRRNGLMCGLVCGIFFSVVALVCSLAVPDNALGPGALLKTMLMVFSAMLGGVVGINTRRRRR